jgi:hypothetical protein
MEISLTKIDIEAIIKDRYEGVSEVKFNSKNVKATLIIPDISRFNLDKKKLQTINKPIEQLPEKTLEERKLEAIQKGLMVPGGAERTIVKIG